MIDFDDLDEKEEKQAREVEDQANEEFKPPSRIDATPSKNATGTSTRKQPDGVSATATINGSSKIVAENQAISESTSCNGSSNNAAEDQAEKVWGDGAWAPMPEELFESMPFRKLPPPRPKRLADVVNKVVPGEFWGLKFPYSPEMLREWGAEWLTKAMHTVGTLPKDNEVTKFTEFDVKAADVTKQDAENSKWGGAGVKILLSVEYKNTKGQPPKDMFIKIPHPLLPGNERAKNSGASSGDWPETMWYNIFGGRFGVPSIATPKMIFSDMSRDTTNFIHIIERIPYGDKGFDDVDLGQYFPGPQKYRDWSLPGDGADFYFAHARALAQFFGWQLVNRKTTHQVEYAFIGPHWDWWKTTYANVEASGKYASPARDKHIAQSMQTPEVQGAMAYWGEPGPHLSFLEIGREFIELPNVKAAFPKALVTKSHLDKIFKECSEIQMFRKELTYFCRAIPEYYGMEHPNAQVDNAFYWRDRENGKTRAGLLDWGGVFPGSIPNCLGNSWIGAEANVMDEHEQNLVRAFTDEFEKETGLRLDVDDFWAHIKVAQGLIFPGCCCNTTRIRSTVEWGKIKNGRRDPLIDDNFLGRCYFVQIELFLAMWKKRSPYKAFQKLKKRLKLPDRPVPKK